MTPLKVPLAVKILIAIGLLVAVNEIAPGTPATVLILVAMYLVLSKSTQVGDVVRGASDSFNLTLRPTAATGRPAPGVV